MKGTHESDRRREEEEVTDVKKEVREIDDAKRELSRLSHSMLILEIGWHVNFKFHLLCPAHLWGLFATESWMKTGVDAAPDSQDNFYKLARISVLTFSVPPQLNVPLITSLVNVAPFQKGGLKTMPI